MTDFTQKKFIQIRKSLENGNFADNVMVMVVRLETAPDAEERDGNHKTNQHVRQQIVIMIIPPNLDSFIYEELRGLYAPRPQEVLFNLEADEESVRWYLGTYFPRSFVEAYETFQGLSRVQYIRDIFQHNDEILILDVGSGSGGYLAGIVFAIRDLFGDNKAIYAISIDGNGFALECQESIAEHILNNNFLLETVHCEVSCQNFSQQLNQILIGYGWRYDIIITSKFISEYFNNPSYGNAYNQQTRGLYKEFLSTSEGWLNENGILVINDITNQVNVHRNYDQIKDFVAKILNRETKEYLNDNNPLLHCVVPLSCAFWHGQCNNLHNCFQQKVFHVEHSRIHHLQRAYEPTKVSYKVFMRNNVAQIFLGNIGCRDCFKIAPKNYCLRGNYHYNTDTPPMQEYYNAFDGKKL